MQSNHHQLNELFIYQENFPNTYLSTLLLLLLLLFCKIYERSAVNYYHVVSKHDCSFTVSLLVPLILHVVISIFTPLKFLLAEAPAVKFRNRINSSRLKTPEYSLT